MQSRNALVQAHAVGQGNWPDFIQPGMLSNGDLQKLITEDQISGLEAGLELSQSRLDTLAALGIDLKPVTTDLQLAGAAHLPMPLNACRQLSIARAAK